MCSLIREISANLAMLDMMRGTPAIYMLYLGYDEVAHHSGPWTDDASGDLKRLDKTFAHIQRWWTGNAAALRLHHPLGSWPVLWRHLQAALRTQHQGVHRAAIAAGTTVAAEIGGDRGAMGLQGMAGELSNVSDSDEANAVDRALANQGQKLAQQGADAVEQTVADPDAAVTAYGSGNAAQVYFDLFPRKIKLSELNEAFPGLVDALVAHEGLGLVIGYADDGSALALGKQGTHNLASGEVSGEDPLLAYAPDSGHGAATIEKRVWQLNRVMDFPAPAISGSSVLSMKTAQWRRWRS